MKIRNGFVSNSSSSSFIVSNCDTKTFDTILTEEQEGALKKIGFKPVAASHPLHIADNTTFLVAISNWKDKNYNYGLYVSNCQDDIIEYLVAYKIPFEALQHYGFESIKFDGETITYIPNFGLRFGPYGDVDLNQEVSKFVVKKSIDDYAESTKKILQESNTIYKGKAFFICPVRGHDMNETREKVEELESQGWDIYWPPRDTCQHDDAGGYYICLDNRLAIEESEVVFFTWDGKSQGCLFDLGMAFALNKEVIVLNAPPNVKTKSFQNMARYWEENGIK